MVDDNGKPMLENVSREEVVRSLATPDSKKPPLGCVERILNMRDRNFIIGACRIYCEKGHAKFKDQQKVDRLKKILKFDETLDYMAMIEDSLDEERRKWQGARNLYRLWQSAKAGALKLSDLKNDYPAFSGEPEKPPSRAPESSPEALRGPDRTFYLPSKLDTFIEEALRKMDWTADQSEGAVALCEKYGIDGDVIEATDKEADA